MTANPALADLIEEYRERRPVALAEIRKYRYYDGVTVSPLDIYSQYDLDRTPGEKLAEIPFVGWLFRPFVERRAQRTAFQRRSVMFEALDNRPRTVRTQLVENVSGWSATRLSTLEVFLLAAEFWNAEEFDREHADRLLRTNGALGHSDRGE